MLDAFLRALPKTELHVHLLGSVAPSTVLTLARRHRPGPVPTDPDALARFCTFRDFAHFVEVYDQVSRLVTEPADVVDLVAGLAAGLAAANVRYAEVTVTPVSHLRAGIDPRALAEALDEGREGARRSHRVELGWIFDTAGEFGVEYAWETLAWVLRHRPPGTVGFGLGGPEIGVERAGFARVFTAARDAGLHSVPHAGETTGPATVWSALTDLGAERIGHGIRAVGDPRLLDHLAAHRIAVEVCPTSNVRTGAVASLDEHPLPRLLRHGVAVTLNTDDPGMFGCDLVGEYRLAHDRLGLTAADLVQIARNGVDAAFCPPETKARIHAAIDAVPVPPIRDRPDRSSGARPP